MKKILLLLISLLAIHISAQNLNQNYINYIKTYSDLAIKEQKKYGIPASITLAQGILESGAGQSELARKSNNHFGIKCNKDWNGKTVSHDDDARNECFRKYSKVEESYEDHSKFLQRPRYEMLFSLKPTDYKAWAHGLKKAGYATDPNYAHKLIKLIEDYDLHQFDLATGRGNKQQEKQTTKVTQPKQSSVQSTTGKMGTVTALANHTVSKQNRTKYATAIAGERYADIAMEFYIKEKLILKYNDAIADRELKAGERVYLGMKKNKAERKYNIHKIKKGETLFSISQQYAIKLNKLCDLNSISVNTPIIEGQTLYLR